MGARGKLRKTKLIERKSCLIIESLPSSKKKAIEELVQGRDIANQLRSLLNKSAGDNNNNNKKTAPADDLVLKIF